MWAFVITWRRSSVVCRQLAFHILSSPLKHRSQTNWNLVGSKKIKCEKLTADRRRTTDAKWWQKLTLPLARWVNYSRKTPFHKYRSPLKCPKMFRKECSFRPDPLTNMVATDDSCFWLSDFLNSSPLKPYCRNRPIRNKNCLWRPCLSMDRN
jgi:thiamine pyrophosphate-dependent acetolactate synthase large subunit-like protein